MSSDNTEQSVAVTPEERRAFLAGLLREKAASAARISSPESSPESGPLSYGQEALIFFDRNAGVSLAYNTRILLRVQGKIDQSILRDCFEVLEDRHSILRTAYPGRTDTQTILPPRQTHIESFNAQGWSNDAVEAFVEAESARPFDLEQGRVWRIRLLHRSEGIHDLLICAHHIAIDYLSFTLLINEIKQLYPALLEGKPSPLAPPKATYLDFVRWQRDYVKSDAANKSLDFWRSHLQNALTGLDFPLDRPRPSTRTDRGATFRFELRKSLMDGVEALARQEATTASSICLAAFAALLHRYTRQEHLVIGTPAAGRTASAFEQVVGYFVNLLPLVADCSGNPTAREYIKRIARSIFDGLDHQNYPFPLLVDRLGVQRRPNRTPLCDVLFSWDKSYGDAAGLSEGGLSIDIASVVQLDAPYDLILILFERENGVPASIQYNTDLFDLAAIENLSRQFTIILESMVNDPQTRILNLAVMPERDRRFLITAQAGQEIPYPRKRIEVLFSEQAALHPDAIALEQGSHRISYRELDRRSDRLAEALRAQGCAKGDFAALLLERSFDMIASILAVLKVGAAYVPLDPSHPAERLSFILQDTGARFVLTQEELAGLLPPHARVMVVGSVTGDPDSTSQPDLELTAAEVAYVMYTSGSTGSPKGVLVPHSAVVRLVRNTDFMSFGRDEVFLLFAPISFDASTLEIWGPLLNACKLVLFDGSKPSLDQLGRTVQQCGITSLWLTSGLFDLMIEHHISDLRALRQLIAGGDALNPATIRKALAGLPGCRLINGYGPTENTTFTACHTINAQSAQRRSIPIGKPIANTRVYILDETGEPTGIGMPGELWAAGTGLALGYWRREELTKDRFIADPFAGAGNMMYRTGDLVRWLSDGNIEFLGRLDNQVKMRGFRIEPGEIEVVLGQHEGVGSCAVCVREDAGESGLAEKKRLIAWAVPRAGAALDTGELRRYLRGRLPDYMVPSSVVVLDSMPLTANGKINRPALPEPAECAKASEGTEDWSRVAPRGEIEQKIAAVWEKALGVGRVARDSNFFELGAHSLMLIQVHSEMNRQLDEVLKKELAVVDLFRYSTVKSLAEYISGGEQEPKTGRQKAPEIAQEGRRTQIAIVGMAGRFPGANDIETLWRNLRNGVESIRAFTKEELKAGGVSEAELERENYVRAGTILDNAEEFDAAFFGFNAREAEITDPQHRVFLECAHEALERSGCDPARYQGRIGVFAGAGTSSYRAEKLSRNREVLESVGYLQTLIGNDRDFVPSRVAYKLNLRGPAVNVQTACSTSLVAVHMACESLESGTCDMALAGGVSIRYPQPGGYQYQTEGIMSPDGHCRPFDERSQGTVGGNGAGVVALKRLADALMDGDRIEAVILGSAINNDGSNKVGYTAPGVNGQALVIEAALAKAGVRPETVSAIEAHGTGTSLGDPIEVAALKRVFGRGTGTGAATVNLSSIKGNLGHLDAAAGVTGLIKAVLELKHGELVPTVHFERANPKLELNESPFRVTGKLEQWQAAEGTPRRIGVSSFGIGGTNAHVLLEEAPRREAAPYSPDSPQVLTLSAKTPTALERMSVELAAWLREHPETTLTAVAWTLQTGRTHHAHRRAIVASSTDDAASALERLDPSIVVSGEATLSGRPTVFMFPGGGTQYPGMGEDLYHSEPVFRGAIDHCADLLRSEIGIDIGELIHPSSGRVAEAAKALRTTRMGLPALFAVEYANARLLMSRGIRPDSMIGHSLGEYVCACIAGVLSLEDAIRLVAARSTLMDRLPPGGMLAVHLSESKLKHYLDPDMAIAAINAPDLCVLSGKAISLYRAEELLLARGIQTQRLHIDVASHSPVVDAILSEFQTVLSGFDLRRPEIPYISNLTGTWITDQQAMDPAYWTAHLRNTVRFESGLSELLRGSGTVFVEAGPGRTLTSLTLQHPLMSGSHAIVNTLRHPHDSQSDATFSMMGAAHLWLNGATPDWAGLHPGEKRELAALPVYSFERERFFVEPSDSEGFHQPQSPAKSLADYFYAPVWKQLPPRRGAAPDTSTWLFFMDETGVASRAAAAIERSGRRIIEVFRGQEFKTEGSRYTIDPANAEHYSSLLVNLRGNGSIPGNFAHFFCVTPALGQPSLDELKERSFYSLIYMVQALDAHANAEPLRLIIVSNGMNSVLGNETSWPEKAMIAGPSRVIPEEYRHIKCTSLDLPATVLDSDIDALVKELEANSSSVSCALRGGDRWHLHYERTGLDSGIAPIVLRDRGVYVITGGTGGIGVEIASYLTRTVRAKVALLSRSGLPVRAERDAIEGGGNTTENPIAGRLRDIERSGGEILILPADAADPVAMAAALRQVEAEFGQINGIIHSAGLTGGGLIQLKTRELAEPVLRAKVDAIYSLRKALKEHNPDFLLLCSSLSSILGGAGHVDYCAANAVLDAFAQSERTRRGTAIVSVNWSAWKGVGMAASIALPEDLSEWKESIHRTGINSEEGKEAFVRILSSGLPQVAVSTVDLAADIKNQLAFTAPSFGVLSGLKHRPHQRPNSGALFTAPRTATEEAVVSVWSEMLGFEEIGVHDNFFLLGGHSLLGVRMLSRLKNKFGVQIPFRRLFAAPTPAGLAETVEDLKREREDAETSELLGMLENLGDEEVNSELETRSTASGLNR